MAISKSKKRHCQDCRYYSNHFMGKKCEPGTYFCADSGQRSLHYIKHGHVWPQEGKCFVPLEPKFALDRVLGVVGTT